MSSLTPHPLCRSLPCILPLGLSLITSGRHSGGGFSCKFCELLYIIFSSFVLLLNVLALDLSFSFVVYALHMMFLDWPCSLLLDPTWTTLAATGMDGTLPEEYVKGSHSFSFSMYYLKRFPTS